MSKLSRALLVLICIFSFSVPGAFAYPGIQGPVLKVRIPDIKRVLLKRQTVGISQHHLMCVYMWNGQEWIIGTAGLIQDEESEIALCRANLEANISDPDVELTKEEYLELEEQYFQILANRGVGSFVGFFVGIVGTPFTLGHSKPCYQEVELINSLAHSIVEGSETTPIP